MVASLLRVLHSGIQNSRLLPPKGNPTIELYSKVFIRAGRFTTQWVRLDFDKLPALGTSAILTIPRKGHLLTRLYLVTTLPDIDTVQALAKKAADASGVSFAGPYFSWTNSLGNALISNATVEIGGARVEQIDGRLLEVLDEFYTPLEKVELTNRLLQRNMTNFPQFPAATTGTARTPVVATTPLPFWFSRGDPGVSLPIDALTADPVKVSITFNSLASLYVSSAKNAVSSTQSLIAGAGYYPLLSSPFWYLNAAGKELPGIQGDPASAPKCSLLATPAMPASLSLGETYIMAEYVYLDKPEANRFRIADIQVPVTQHYPFDAVDTNGAPNVYMPLKIPNPTRNILFFAQRYEATMYNAPFLCTRDLSGADALQPPWWPNATPIQGGTPGQLVPAFQFRDSEPVQTILFEYEGRLIRYATRQAAIFRSLLPSYEMAKSPFVNRYMYSLHFGLNHGHLPPSQPCGEANLDKVFSMSLQLEFKPFRGSIRADHVPRYLVYVWAETYNILRVYAGRGGLMFGY
jgi:hypothetical protein